MVQYMNGSHSTIGICESQTRLPGGGLRPLPASPSPALFGPWQEAQLLSYTTSPRSTVARVRSSDNRGSKDYPSHNQPSLV
jgi:hypothetical protein